MRRSWSTGTCSGSTRPMPARSGSSGYRTTRWARGPAFHYLLKAQQLTPDDHEVRLKLGGIYLLVGKREEAREEAGSVLGKEPNNLDALALLADTSTTPQEMDATIGLLEGQRATLGDRAKLHLTLGVLYLRKQDLPGAERAFQEAVAREPKSVEAHSLLGSSTSSSVTSLKPSASSRSRLTSRRSARRRDSSWSISISREETRRGQAHPVGDHPEGSGLSARLASPGPDRACRAKLRREPQGVEDNPQEKSVRPRRAFPSGPRAPGQARDY